MTRIKAKAFDPSNCCDGTVSVFTLGSAEGSMLRNLHLDTLGVIVLNVRGTSLSWPGEEIENKKMPETHLQTVLFF